MSTYAYNRKVRFDYQILEKYEAGLSLFGFEVKSIKTGRISLKGSFVVIKDNEAWLLNAHISPYQVKNTPENYDPTRSRRLLLHKKEIKTLIGKQRTQGLTLVPLRVYSKGSRIKLEFGLAKGKKKFDKRQAIQKREAERKIGRALRGKK